MEGKTIGESVSEAGVKSAISTVLTTTALGSITVGFFPTVAFGVFVSFSVDLSYEYNLFGIKDFTESIGNFIDNPIKVINELIENSEFKIENIKFVP